MAVTIFRPYLSLLEEELYTGTWKYSLLYNTLRLEWSYLKLSGRADGWYVDYSTFLKSHYDIFIHI